MVDPSQQPMISGIACNYRLYCDCIGTAIDGLKLKMVVDCFTVWVGEVLGAKLGGMAV